MTPDQIPLRDIHLPPPVSWWPPAPGWWLLLGLLVGVALWWAARRRRTAARPLSTELGSLNDEVWRRWRDIKGLCEQGLNCTAVARELSVLMRQVALSMHPRRNVAGLTGEAWLRFLDQRLGSDLFRCGAGRVLITAPYRAADSADIRSCMQVCEQWLRASLAQTTAVR